MPHNKVAQGGILPLETYGGPLVVSDAASMPAHMKALRMVGVPYTDEQIAKASEELKDKLEVDAMVAYLQVLGTTLK